MLSTTKREKFARNRALGMNGFQAAIAAGYSGRSAHSWSSRLSRIPEVSRRIEELKNRTSVETLRITRDLETGATISVVVCP
jgi:phage terminase small subunit